MDKKRKTKFLMIDSEVQIKTTVCLTIKRVLKSDGVNFEGTLAECVDQAVRLMKAKN